jgi:putative photosynthetic complex assembly protein 2
MMADHAPPLLYALAIWFVSTGVILWLDRLPRATYRWSLAVATLVAGAALWGVVQSAGDSGSGAAYLAFTAALALWGWHEMAFLMGRLTGPNKAPCPPGARGWRRFRLAAGTLIHHEIALAATLLLIAGLTWNAPNQTAALTFLLLFGMRLSTKLNIFLGVPNMSEEFLPDHLTYLKSYFRKRAFNLLMPLSLIGGTGVAIWLGNAALAAAAAGVPSTGYTLLFGLAVLGVIEHLFLIAPVPDTALWRWAMPARAVPAMAAQTDITSRPRGGTPEF